MKKGERINKDKKMKRVNLEIKIEKILKRE